MRRATRNPGDPATARVELYAAMKETILAELRAYYTTFPDRLMDDRSNVAVERSLAGLQRFYDLLDTYDIEWKKGKGNPATTGADGAVKRR